MTPPPPHPNEIALIQFLKAELAVPEAAIAFALKQGQRERGPLQMILWHYGLISMEQLQQIFDWLAGPSHSKIRFIVEA